MTSSAADRSLSLVEARAASVARRPAPTLRRGARSRAGLPGERDCRAWPLVAESWAPVVIPVLAIVGTGVAQWVAPLHLLLGYAVLGVLVARKPA